MGDDDLVLLAIALLYRLVDSLATGAVAVVVVLAGITAAAGLIAWAGRTLPTGRRSPGDEVLEFTRSSGDLGRVPLDELKGWTCTATLLGPSEPRHDDETGGPDA